MKQVAWFSGRTKGLHYIYSAHYYHREASELIQLELIHVLLFLIADSQREGQSICTLKLSILTI